jgi:hypothetical protein
VDKPEDPRDEEKNVLYGCIKDTFLTASIAILLLLISIQYAPSSPQ